MGQPRYLNSDQEENLVEEVASGRFRTPREIADWVESMYGVKFKGNSISHIHHLEKREDLVGASGKAGYDGRYQSKAITNEVHSEFRDGNVPAGHDQMRVLRESLEYLPAGVEQVLLRSDTAGYQWELLRYCAEGRDERFGVIEFAVGVDVTPEFREAVAEVDDDQWHELYRQTEVWEGRGGTWSSEG